jgi:hypothetical protein
MKNAGDFRKLVLSGQESDGIYNELKSSLYSIGLSFQTVDGDDFPLITGIPAWCFIDWMQSLFNKQDEGYII